MYSIILWRAGDGVPFAHRWCKKPFTLCYYLKINLCEEMIPSCIKGRKGYTGGALLFILIPQNKYIYHNKSLDELDVQQHPISTCYYHFVIIT